MNLENFIIESMCQIVEGVTKARERISQINRENEAIDQFVFQAVKIDKSSENHDVNFDVALTVIEESDSNKLIVVGLKHHTNGSYEQRASLVSRVEFSVPLCYVQSTTTKKSYLV